VFQVSAGDTQLARNGRIRTEKLFPEPADVLHHLLTVKLWSKTSAALKMSL